MTASLPTCAPNSKRAKGDGIHGRDRLLGPLRDAERRDLIEIIEDRTERRSTLVASQVPVASWHEVIGDPTLADAICDRLIHRAHKIVLKGASQREPRTKGDRPDKAGR
jgi:hypothetical protein